MGVRWNIDGLARLSPIKWIEWAGQSIDPTLLSFGLHVGIVRPWSGPSVMVGLVDGKAWPFEHCVRHVASATILHFSRRQRALNIQLGPVIMVGALAATPAERCA